MKLTIKLKNFKNFLVFYKILLTFFLYSLLGLNIVKAENQDCPKVVSISPELTEIIYELNAQSCLVGIDINSNYPKEVLQLPRVADYYNLNQEKIAQLKAEIILLSGSYNTLVVNKNSKLKSKFLTLQLSSISGLKESISILGELLHKQKNAQKLNFQIDETIAKIKKQYRSTQTINTTILLWQKPFMVAGKNSLINELVTICRAKNVYDQYNIAYQIVDPENIYSQKVSLIISMTDDKIDFPHLNIVYLSPLERDILSRATPRAIKQGIPKLCKIIDSARTIY